jgi:hypothetical protein
MTREETARVLAVMMAKWPNHPIPNPEATAAAYHLALEDVPYDAAMAAAAAWMKRSRFFPAACELRELAVTAQWDLPSASEAWAEVRRGLSHGGVYREPEWSCLPLQQTIRAIGWRVICTSPEGDGDMAERFSLTYRTYRDRAIREADIPALWAGDPPPMLVRGNPESRSAAVAVIGHDE